MSLKPILFIPDTHRPYHDKRAWRVMIKAAQLIKPYRIVIQGDFADFYSVSSHNKDPNRVKQLEVEVKDVLRGFDELDALGAVKKDFIAGNHENRLERYLSTRAPEVFNLLSIPELFQLKARGWTYTPYRSDLHVGKIHVTHDVGACGRYAVFKALDTYQDNSLTGHTHRLAYIVEGTAIGIPHISASFGWLGDKTQADYMHRIKANRDWALGFGVGYQRGNGVIHVQPVPIINYSVVVNGKLVEA